MKTDLTPSLSRFVLVVAAFASLLLNPANVLGQCVDNSMAHTVGTCSSCTGVLTSYNPALKLFNAGQYRYLYAATGGNFLSNISLVVNGNPWYSGPPRYLNPSPNTLSFSFTASPSSTPLCSSETIQIRFERKIGTLWHPLCRFDLKVVIAEYGERNNLTIVKSLGEVYYVGDDKLAHSMTWNPNTNLWGYAAVNVPSGWGTVRVAGQMASFDDGTRIFFKNSVDNKLYNLVRSGANSWTLSQVIPGVPPLLPNVAGIVAARNNNEVVFYGSDQKIHRLLLSGGTWTDQVIIPSGGWGTVFINEKSIRLSSASSNIFFASLNGKLYNVYGGGPWTLEQISPSIVNANYVYDYYVSDMIALENNNVFYKGKDGFIHRYTKTGSVWNFDPMPISTTSETNVIVAGYLTKFPGEDRVFYKAQNGRVYNVYKQSGVWYNYPLDNAMINAAGDLLAVQDKIFYINHDKRVHNLLWTGNAWWDDSLSKLSQANTKACILAYY